MVEFKDFDTALACYHSPEYAEAKAFVEGKADLNIAVIEGYDGRSLEHEAPAIHQGCRRNSD